MKVAFYENDITPSLYTNMPGYFNERLGSDVYDRLFTKATVIESDSNKIAFVSVDANFITEDIKERICHRIARNSDIKPENVTVNATHLHNAGAIVNWGKFVKRDEEYVSLVCEKSADAVLLADLRLVEAKISYGNGYLDDISFYRIYEMKNGTLQTNPGKYNPDIIKPYGQIDTDVTVLYVEDISGKPLGTITNFACHQDCVNSLGFSGDYSSQLSDRLKEKFGDSFVSVFFTGTCGNINHFDVNSDKDTVPGYYRIMGNKLAEEVLKVIDKSEYISSDNVAVCSQTIKIKKRMVDFDVEAEIKELEKEVVFRDGETIGSQSPAEMLKLVFDYDLRNYIKDTNFEKDVPIMVFSVGDICFYSLPGEIFVEYGKEIKEKSPYTKNMIFTNANGLFGYIPLKNMFMPTVYESKLSSTSYLAPEAGELIAEKALEGATKLFNTKKTRVMERRASDNKYLHKDFHVSLDLGIAYIGDNYGEEAVREYLSTYAKSYYKKMTITELEKYFRDIYETEEASESLTLTVIDGILTVEVEYCPAIAFMKKSGHTVSKYYSETTKTLYKTLADICGFKFVLDYYYDDTGKAKFRFMQ